MACFYAAFQADSSLASNFLPCHFICYCANIFWQLHEWLVTFFYYYFFPIHTFLHGLLNCFFTVCSISASTSNHRVKNIHIFQWLFWLQTPPPHQKTNKQKNHLVFLKPDIYFIFSCTLTNKHEKGATPPTHTPTPHSSLKGQNVSVIPHPLAFTVCKKKNKKKKTTTPLVEESQLSKSFFSKKMTVIHFITKFSCRSSLKIYWYVGKKIKGCY